jgi:hypothetical protein
MAFLDGSFAPAKKGTKWMLAIEGNELPLGFRLASASTAEIRLAEQTLDMIGMSRPYGRPKQRPGRLVADRGYDRSAFRAALWRRGIKMSIPA